MTGLAVLCLCLCVGVAQSFMASDLFVFIFSHGSSTHGDIVKEALRRVATNFTKDYPEKYNSDKLDSMVFQQALRDFGETVKLPDNMFDKDHKKPEAHFDDEEIVNGSKRIIEYREMIRSASYGDIRSVKDARELTGRVLHTLQDFYSHSNWVEKGETEPNYELGENIINASQVAGPEATCYDCPDDTDCSQNVIDNGGKLTTGYFELRFISSPTKPISSSLDEGKCSHGGLFDGSASRMAKGGINKDCLNQHLSPHAVDHEEAAALAIDSTVAFFNIIRGDLIKTAGFREFAEEDFASLIGLPVGSGTSWCFIVDATAGMVDHLFGIVSYATTALGVFGSSTSSKPTDYVLSLFSMLGSEDLITSTESADMILLFSSLSTMLAMNTDQKPGLHAILLAAQVAQAGSTCIFFSNSPPVDNFLYPAVLSVLMTSKIRLNSFISGGSRRRRSTTHRKRQASFSYIEELTRLSGGSVINIDEADISSVLQALDAESASLQVPIFIGGNIQSALTFYVDNSVTKFTMKLSEGSGSLQTVSITSPDGQPFSAYTDELSQPDLRILSVETPPAGVWSVSVSTGDGHPFSASVAASSPLSFSYQMFEAPDTTSLDIRLLDTHPLNGNPVEGTEYSIIVDVSGSTDPATGASRGTLSSITSVLLVNEDGQVASTLPASEIAALKQYIATSILPNTGFRIAVEGKDADENIVRRYDMSFFAAAAFKLGITGRRFYVSPGSTVTVNVKVTNVGTAASRDVTVSDTGGFYAGSNPTSISLARNASMLLPLVFHALSNATSGFVSTATVSVGSSSLAFDNYVTFDIVVDTETADANPPSCLIRNSQGSCRPISVGHTEPCESKTWRSTFVASDENGGLSSIEAFTSSSEYSLEPSTFEYGTPAVTATYESSCCHQKATILITGVSGSTAECQLVAKAEPPTSQSETNQKGKRNKGRKKKIIVIQRGRGKANGKAKGKGKSEKAKAKAKGKSEQAKEGNNGHGNGVAGSQKTKNNQKA